MENEDFYSFSTRCKLFLDPYIPDPYSCFVAGGIFPRLYHNLNIRDVDIFTKSDDSFEGLRKDYVDAKYTEVTSSRDYVRFFDPQTSFYVDLINFHSPKSLAWIGTFDFTICRLSYSCNSLGYYTEEDFNDIKNRKLIFTGRSNRSAGSNNLLTRAKKYIDLGFTLDDNELTKMYKFLTSSDPEVAVHRAYVK